MNRLRVATKTLLPEPFARSVVLQRRGARPAGPPDVVAEPEVDDLTLEGLAPGGPQNKRNNNTNKIQIQNK